MDHELSFGDVEAAARRIASTLPVTPVWHYPLLDQTAGCTVFVKHENVQPTGAFKVRGGLNLFASMTAADRHRAVVTASTGNHAQSVAYGAAAHGVRAVVVMPTSSPTGKIRATAALGAEVVLHGQTMTEAMTHAHQLAAEHGLRLVNPGNEPQIIAGHATVHLELLTQVPDLDAVIVPIGSGTSAAGACLVRAVLQPQCRVIGVQSAQAPAAYRAFHSGEPAAAPCDTEISGLATGRSFELPQSLLADRLDDFVLVTDDNIVDSIRVLAHDAHTLAEGAGAAGLAAVLADPGFRGLRVAIICSGGNASAAEIAALAVAAPASGRPG